MFNKSIPNSSQNSFNNGLLFFGINLFDVFDGEVVQGAKANSHHSTHKANNVVRHTEVRSRQSQQHRL